MKPLTDTPQWKALEHHAESLQCYTLNDITHNTSHRKAHYIANACAIRLDYTNQRITDHGLHLLGELAEARGLRQKINQLLHGDKVNQSENRPALHTALRAQGGHAILVDDRNILPDVLAARHAMQSISDKIRNKQWLGFTGLPITDVVNIGIGGSDLGPQFCINALADYVQRDLDFHFISDADPTRFRHVTQRLNPATTVFIISSKSFTTEETLYNAQKAMAWIAQPQHLDRHFIAVTANPEKAIRLGIKTVVPIWDWVGGRFSFCSAINLITAIAIGYEQFDQLLQGAAHMDDHFQHAPWSSNLPVLLAMIGIWNNNFLGIHNHLMLVYAAQLERFVAYVQQLDMESNGKSLDNQGRAVNHATGPLIWGGLGNQAQHSYYQLLCQGTHKVTADFLSIQSFDGELINTFCYDKLQVLTQGIHAEQTMSTRYIPGNMTINHLQLTRITPYTLGALVALYEHKIFTQSVVWDINPFDQPGVESAKHRRRSTRVPSPMQG